MFDAKSLIEMMMRGAAPAQPQQPGAGGGGGLGDLLGQLQGMMKGGAGGAAGGAGDIGEMLRKLGGGAGGQAAPTQSSAAAEGGGMGGLGDLLGKVLGGGGAPGASGGQATGGQAGGGGIGDIGDMLRKMMPGAGGAAGQGGAAGGLPGGLGDILSQVFGQATSGVKDGARRLDEATGASGHARDALGQATGQSPEDILAKLKELVGQHQMGAGAAAAGLGGLVLGTKTGRTLAGKAAKLGGLALIGGLAYKALQNYQEGRPILGSADEVHPAPQGSGFEPAAVTNDSATLYLSAMISAAAADGRIDEGEQTRIMGGLKQAGLGEHAEEYLANALNNPMSIEDLAAGVKTQEEAVQLYTAARIAIDDKNEQEHRFLATLAASLGMDAALRSHIDAAAKQAA